MDPQPGKLGPVDARLVATRSARTIAQIPAGANLPPGDVHPGQSHGTSQMNKTPDPTDLNIIETLRPNPRMTNKEVAAQLQLAETTVAQRIRAMAEQDIMRVVAQKHVFSDGYNAMHFLFVNTTGKSVQGIIAKIAQLEDVIGVSQGIGNPDICINARSDSIEGAHHLANRIGAIKGVSTVEAVPCFHIHKFASNLSAFSMTNAPSQPGENRKDDQVIHAFMQDGRQSNREIGRQLGVSEGAIRQRLNKLLQSGQMQFQVVCNPEALGIGTIAVVRATTLSHHTNAILGKLTAMQSTGFVAEVAGAYNILAVISTSDTLSLGNLCDNELLSARGVHALDVQLLVAHAKHQYHLAHFDPQTRIPSRK